MRGESTLERDSAESTFVGELRRLPPGPGMRLVEAVTLITLVRSVTAAVLRYALGHRHRFAAEPGPMELVLEHEHTLLGTTFRRKRTVLPLRGLVEITLEKGGEPPQFAAGLAALAMGTFVGFRFLFEGVRAPGGAPWLLGLGALLVLSGILMDFFVGSGRSPRSTSGRPEVSVRVQGGRGWVLAGLELETASELLARIEAALATEGASKEDAPEPGSSARETLGGATPAPSDPGRGSTPPQA